MLDEKNRKAVIIKKNNQCLSKLFYSPGVTEYTECFYKNLFITFKGGFALCSVINIME